jgi:6-phosphogluconate dehydrogenase
VGLQADRGQKEIKLEMQLGLIGLGKMGGNLALQALEKKIDIIGKARSKKPELEEKDVKVTTDYSPFVKHLKHPRVIYLFCLPAPP